MSKDKIKNMENPEHENADETGAFLAFVLLSANEFDKEQLIGRLKNYWDLDIENESEEDVFFSINGMMASASLMPVPVPEHEAETNATFNYMWPEAVETAKNHKAHIMVTVLGKDTDIFERGKLFTKIVASCCHQKYATGVYTSHTVFEPGFYSDFADMLKEGELPIYNWVWIGLYHSDKGTCGCTYGMRVFGKDEMEVLGTDAQPSDVMDFLFSLVSYVLNGNITLNDGETIGFSAEDKHKITRNEGFFVPGMTLKISY